MPFIAELYRQGKRGEDPVITYKRPEQLSVQDFIDLTNRVEEALNSSAAKAE